MIQTRLMGCSELMMRRDLFILAILFAVAAAGSARVRISSRREEGHHNDGVGEKSATRVGRARSARGMSPPGRAPVGGRPPINSAEASPSTRAR